MKLFCIFVLAFFLLGVFSLSAQDLIVLRSGNIIEAKVMEISPSEIRYKRIDHLEGPTIVIMATYVLSIRYENGRTEIINTIPVTGQQNERLITPQNTAIDPNKFIFGINANPGGAIGYALYGPSGTGISIELGRGNFNSEINLMFPIGGIAALFTFNRFWHSRIGGAYFGGGIGISFFDAYYYDPNNWSNSYYYTGISLPVGINAGYKFVTRSGIFFKTGAFVGFDFGYLWGDSWLPVFIKPDLAIGWTMR